MVFLAYDDIPGVIGRVGTLFGGAEINIANMAVSRYPPGREGADGALDRHGRAGRGCRSGCAPRASTRCHVIALG